VTGTLIQSRCAALGLSLALLTLSPPSGQAQTGGMPAPVEQRLRDMGRVINPPETAKLYSPLHKKEPHGGVKIIRDIKYGADERQALDVFAPDQTDGSRPVLVFVHGGAFVAGNKKGPPGSFYYDNIGVWAVGRGLIGVNITYRLAPKHTWPTGAEDLASALRWVANGIAQFGGDRHRIFLAGHSAGAVHVADYLALPRLHVEPDGPGVKGAILISGLFDLARFPAGSGNKAYFGEDASKYPERSSQPGLLRTPVPLLVVYAELDPPSFEVESKALSEELCQARRCPRLVRLSRHNHMSEVYSINTDDAELANHIAAFVNSVR
jgi:triacylglycerol lipase